MVKKLTGLRSVCEAAFGDALLAADPEEAVHRHFRVKGDVLRAGDVDYFLNQFNRVFVIGAGKASVRMARALERILGPRLDGGVVITTRGQAARLSKVLVREASHPLPDEDGARATEEMLEFVDALDDHDLVVCALSGGGSALLTAPIEGLNVTDLSRANKLMLAAGMPIDEINAVRKRLSRVKGGKLAGRIFPATLINLILSDVIGDKVDVIASGPTARDRAKLDPIAVLKQRGLWRRVPKPVRDALLASEEPETRLALPIKNEVFAKVHHLVVGSNRTSLEAAERRAKRMGMNVMTLSSSVKGESREIAHFYAALAREIRERHAPLAPPACLIAGGETTVTVTGDGKGGRCQELALALALELREIEGVVFMAAGTDGVDGPTEAAGAVADTDTHGRAQKLGLEPEEILAANDSNALFAALGDLIVTGPTGTNVMDVHILLIG